jgi:hypothetical protein
VTPFCHAAVPRLNKDVPASASFAREAWVVSSGLVEIIGLYFGETIACDESVTHKEQAQREAIDSPFGSFQPVTSPKPSESL